MTIEIEIPTTTQESLKRQAANRGLTFEEYLQLVVQWEAESGDSEALSREHIELLRAGIQRGLEDEKAGRVRPLAAFVREQREKHGL